jgi:superfamily II DNA or RNA helicase
MTAAADDQLRQARHRLAALERERAEIRASIAALEQHAGGPQTSTAAGRVALFSSLFRGRPDVFATRWESRTQPDRSGWAPRCANEWRPGICEKPKVKCAECVHRGFVPFSDAEVRRHLEGHQTIGIYPLLANETCWLLAIDLDGPTWAQDAAAVREVAAEADICVLVERSRSGDGAHVWLLFSAPVAARVARAIGSWLLTQAMSRRSISMASYDRLFPNQDTMPAGGFGNLIALPLQRARRENDCTVFLDDDQRPYADQWTYLAQVRRLDPGTAQALAAEAERAGRTLALRHWTETKVVPVMARELPPSSALPATLTVRLGGRLEIPTAGLSTELRDRLRRTAAFANPVFHERERSRLSTYATPRVIACHEETADRLLLPRGCLDGVRVELESAGASLVLEDARSDGAAIDVTFSGTLSADQRAAVEAMGKHDTGVLVAPPGCGKTVMATALIARRQRSTLVLVHRRPLLEQWIKRLAQFLDLAPNQIGSPAKPGASGIDVAMVQSLTRRDTPAPLGCYGHVIVDECHHAPAVSIEKLLRGLPARHVTGLTATPRRRDGHHPIIAMQCGPVRHTLTSTQATETAVRRVLIERQTTFDATVLPTDPGIQEVLGAIAADPGRTKQIADDALTELAEGRYPLVLSERRDHLRALAELLRPQAPDVVVLTGGMGAPARRVADAALAATDEPRIILATGRYIGEGFDDPRLDTLILAMPIAWKGTMTQYAGRLHRHHAAKREIRILDYVDHEIPVLRRMYAKRQRAYAALGYQPG